MAPDDAKVPLAPIDDVLVEPVSRHMGVRTCTGPPHGSQQCTVTFKKALCLCIVA